MSEKKQKLMIIDGNALIHRSFHALPDTIKTKKGVIVNAVYGFTSFLIKSINELKPKYVVLTLDEKALTFRHKKFKEYKAKRIKAPDELYSQIPLVKKIATAFNIPIFSKSGFEADDLIGTISKKTKKNIENVIVTGDMDTLQLINENTKVYTMSRGIADSIIYDNLAVKQKIGVNPEQIIDYKALRGDPSDNIPGVPGIGEKTAVELLNKFKTLNNLYKNIEENTKQAIEKIKPRILGLLKENKKSAYLSQELATIKCDIPIEFDLEKTLFNNYNEKEVINILSEFEFKSLLLRIKNLSDKQNNNQENKFDRNKRKFNYILINKEKDFNNFLKKINQQKHFTFDTETSSFDTIMADLLGISFSWEQGKAYYIVINNKLNNNNNNINLFNYNNSKLKNKNLESKQNPWIKKLKPIFENKNIKKCAHNSKFDIRVMSSVGIDVKGLNFDTMIASYLFNPGTRKHGLDALTFSEFGFEKISKDDLLGKGKDKINFRDVDIEKLSLYSCEDADFTERLAKKLKIKIKKEKLECLYNNIEMPLIKVLCRMEDNGMKINKNFLYKMNKKISEQIKILEKNIYSLSGKKFNIKSPKQLQEILFTNLNIKTENIINNFGQKLKIKKTKTGISTANDELEKLINEHKIIPLIKEYRELTKLINTYIEALPKLINKKTNRVHTSFNQTITATGRLSSTNPNLQNIPVKTELGREIRKAFITENGNKLISIDYSQIELRITAHLSEDKKMIKAFQNGIDIHTATASEINQVKIENVTDKMRREAKAINFGVLYGQGPHGLARGANIIYQRAQEFIDQYFTIYSDVKKYIDNLIKIAKEKGYAKTIFGHKRNLNELHSSMPMVRKTAERMAINTPIQGTAAGIIKKAMIEVDKQIINKKIQNTRMLLQVHDELIFETRNNDVQNAIKIIKQIMENIIKLKVPLKVDVKIGENWGDMKKIEIKNI